MGGKVKGDAFMPGTTMAPKRAGGGLFAQPVSGSHWGDFKRAFTPGGVGNNAQALKLREWLMGAGQGLASGDLAGGMARGAEGGELAALRAALNSQRMPRVGIETGDAAMAKRPKRALRDIPQKIDWWRAMMGG